MVELFAVPHLTGSPDVSGPVIVVANDELPTPAKLSGPLRKAQNPLDGIFTRFETPRPCILVCFIQQTAYKGFLRRPGRPLT